VRITYVDAMVDSFKNVPCVSTFKERSQYSVAEVYEMVGYAAFSEPALAVWTRGRQTNRWRDLRGRELRDYYIPVDGRAYGNWAEVVPGTVSAEGCSLRAYTYKYYRDGAFAGWYPVNGETGVPTCSSAGATSLAYGYVTAGSGEKTRTDRQTSGPTGGPNPSSEPYGITWVLADREEIDAVVYDVRGRRVRALFSGPAGPGDLRLIWDGRDARGRRAPSGAYFLRITGRNSSRIVKVIR
jgi:hypothetical protein